MKSKSKTVIFGSLQATELMIHLKNDSKTAESLDPSPQQRCCLELLGKDPATGSNKGFNSNAHRPLPNRMIITFRKQRCPKIKVCPS